MKMQQPPPAHATQAEAAKRKWRCSCNWSTRKTMPRSDSNRPTRCGRRRSESRCNFSRGAVSIQSKSSNGLRRRSSSHNPVTAGEPLISATPQWRAPSRDIANVRPKMALEYNGLPNSCTRQGKRHTEMGVVDLRPAFAKSSVWITLPQDGCARQPAIRHRRDAGFPETASRPAPDPPGTAPA